MISFRYRSLALASTALALLPVPCFAQSTDPQINDGAEIVVTAQKREQKLLDVPLSITAVGGEEIAKRGAQAIEDLQYSVPGLSITQFAPGSQRATIRGISVYSGLPAVGVYLDEMPLNTESAATGQDVRLFDIKRVEVLRGPQGTLYGQGAMGGTIRYITNDVDFSGVEAAAGGEIAAVDAGGTDWMGQAMVNVPLVTDRVGIRVAGVYQNYGGWIDNPVLGEENFNHGYTYALRAKLGAKLTDRLNLTITGQYQDTDINSQSASDADRQTFEKLPAALRSKVTLVNAILSYDLDFATLLSSTGWIRRRDFQTQDLGPAFIPILEAPAPFGFGYPAGTFDTIAYEGLTKSNIFAQELRLASSGAGPFNWTFGGFYRNSRSVMDFSSTPDPDIVPVQLYGQTGIYPANSESWAVFGEASYQLVPTLTLLVGGRYFSDKRIQNSSSTIFGASAVDVAEDSFHSFSPRFNLSWQPNDQINLYANVAKGFRSGGFNPSSAGAGLGDVPAAYEPDTIWTYELGGKFQTADRKLSGELAVYRNEWSDVQSATNFAGLPIVFTTNAGKLNGWGVDGSLTWLPVSAVTLTVTGGWNNMEYRSLTAEHMPGDPADYVPKFTGSASAEYRFDVGSMPGFVRFDYQHSSPFQIFLRNIQTTPTKTDTQDIINARIGLSGDAWNASFFVRNLTNKNYITYPAFGTKIYPTRMEPRQIGVSFSVKY
jgi:iron complex outermembrane receptor protein